MPCSPAQWPGVTFGAPPNGCRPGPPAQPRPGHLRTLRRAALGSASCFAAQGLAYPEVPAQLPWAALLSANWQSICYPAFEFCFFLVFLFHLIYASYSLMKSFLLSRVLPTLVLLVAIGETVLAQAPADGGPTPLSPAAVPLDGGVSLLLAGGVAYGLSRLRNRRKRA